MKCIACNNILTGRQLKYCSRVCKNKTINNNHKIYICQQERGLKRKIKLVILKGGKCTKCPYKNNYAALVFHHRNPEEKSFQLDLRNCSNRSWNALLLELEKCDLLCSNCHMEIHHPDLVMGHPGFEPGTNGL